MLGVPKQAPRHMIRRPAVLSELGNPTRTLHTNY